jgi:mRNA-degrading endonuclease toxin of MazEF toxin-antitoxin module
MLTGEIWHFDLGEPVAPEAGFDHFGLIVSPPRFTGPLRMVCPLTSTRRPYPWRIEIEPTPDNGLKHISYVQSEHLRSISVRRGDYRLGTVDPMTLLQVKRILRTLLEL